MIDNGEYVLSLVKRHAPPELMESEETCLYLTSLLESWVSDQEDQQLDYQSLADMIDPFFSSGNEESSQELAKDLATFAAERKQQEHENKVRSFTGVNQEMDRPPRGLGEAASTAVPTSASESDDDKDNSDEKASARRKKLQERKAKREARKQQKLKNQKNASNTETFSVEDLDDNASAWKERRQEGKAWGGRGHGGRGIRGDVNTASNIHLRNVSLQYAGNDLLENSTIQISGGHRYGLVGRNGCGKSTLLRRLAQKAIPGFPQDASVFLVEQHAAGGNETALQALVNADEERAALLLEQQELEEQLENTVVEEHNNNNLDSVVQRLGDIAGELDAIDADGAEERAIAILRGLQFSKDMMNRPTCNLSGGWRMRLALAQALFVPSDLLLLDEPTNHLDLHALLWLTDVLARSDQTLIVVSHDRVFLDMCTDIISFEHRKLKYHVGNYSAYQQQETEHAARQAQILDASERQRAKAVAFVQKQQASANKKNQDPKKQRQAKMVREKKLDRIGMHRPDGKRYKNMSLKKLSEDYMRVAEKVVVETDEPVLRFKFPTPNWGSGMGSGGNALAKLDDLAFRYNSNQPLLIQEVTLDIHRGSKVAVVGKNGAGKSTLLKVITDEISSSGGATCSLRGAIWRHPSLRIGHVAQHCIEALEQHSDMSVIAYAEEFLRAGSACTEVTRTSSGNIRQYLGAFGLGGKHAARTIGSLSGGERMRLCFATVMAERPHVLVLDEPTNHLDMETLDALSSALDDYEGAVVVVSHNQGFLCGFCNELWVVENGHVNVRHNDTESFEDMFSNYRSDVLNGAKQRGNVRETRAKMAKLAQHQRVGAQLKSGFVG